MAEIREELVLVDSFSTVFDKFVNWIDKMTGDLAISNSAIYQAIVGHEQLAYSIREVEEGFHAVTFPLELWSEALSQADIDLLQVSNSTRELVESGQLLGEAIEYEKNALEELNLKTTDVAGTFEQVTSESDRAGKAITDSSNAAKKAADGGFDKLLKKVLKLTTALLGIQSIGKNIQNAIQDERFEVIFQTRLQDLDYGSALYKFSQDFANDVGRPIEDVLNSTNRFLSNTTSPQNLQKLLDIADRFALISTNDDFAGLSTAISTAFRTGNLRTLSGATGISTQVFEQVGLKDAAKANDLNAYIAALEESLALVGLNDEAYERLQNTTGSAFRKLKNTVANYTRQAAQEFSKAIGPAIQRLNEWLNTESAAKFFNALGAAFRLLGNIADIAIAGFIKFADFISDNLEYILVGLGVVIAGVAAKFAIMAASTLVANWQLIALIALVGVAIVEARELGYTFEEIFTVIGNVIGAIVVNLINTFIQIYNFFGGIVDAVKAGFNSIPGAIAIVMQTVADVVLGTLERIAGAIDAIFGSNLSAELNAFRGKLYNMARDYALGETELDRKRAKKSRGAFISEDDTTSEWFKRLDLLELGDVAGQFGDAFGKFGRRLDEFEFDETLDKFRDALDGFTGLDQIGEVGEVGSVGKLKDNTVSLADEDFKVLLNLLDRRNQIEPIINILTPQNSVNVTATGTNLSETEYANVIAREIAAAIEEATNSSTTQLYRN